MDPLTGGTTSVGPLGFGRVEGLAFDPLSTTLYGADADSGQLLTIDTGTGAGTAVGSIGFTEVYGLAFDPNAGVLYGVAGPSAHLLTIDPVSGAGTLVGPTGLPTIRGLAFDAAGGTLYGIQTQGIVSRLAMLDPSTGAGTPVGYLMHPDTGRGYLFELQPVTYCTAGVSSSGCRAALSACGLASGTDPAGFVLSAATVEGGRNGTFVFGTSGRQASPWGNGTSFQCVVPPLKRAGMLHSGGAPGSCAGTMSQDLNSLWCSTCPAPGANPGAGATVQAQLWFRDPGSTSNRTTGLSDAIEFVVAP